VAEEDEDPDAREVERDAEEAAVEERISLHDQRIGAVMAALRATGAKRVLALGCGEGRLLSELVKDHTFTEIVGVDVSARSLEVAARRLRLERMNERQRERLRLLQGALTYRDARLAGYDAAVLMEVIEHVEPGRLPALERAVFESAHPANVVLTTPNAEYNVRFETLPAGRFRHRDHRFEWTRHQFIAWAASVGDRFGYMVRNLPIGPDDVDVGAPTQMAVFSR
jgi:3' terminal RNA ribose 2'-O-methyltransferase Hen1